MRVRGMTLLEVMVALAIFAVAGLTVVRTVSQQLVGLTLLEEKTIATWVADNRQVEVALRKNWPGLSWTNGRKRWPDRPGTGAGAAWKPRIRIFGH